MMTKRIKSLKAPSLLWHCCLSIGTVRWSQIQSAAASRSTSLRKRILSTRPGYMVRAPHSGSRVAKFDPFLSLDCATVEGVRTHSLSFPWIAPPRPPPWRNPRKERDKILPSGNLDVNIFNFQGGQHCTNAATPSATAPPTSATSPSRTATRASASSISTPSTARRRRGRRSSGSTATMHCRDTIQLLGELNCVARFA